MASRQAAQSTDLIEIDLRNPAWAALLAWLIPGAGHFYQRRYSKGALFLVCILSTYFFGLTIGGGHVVYASWTKNDRRWQYGFQLPVGAAALPALVQSHRVKNGKEPFFGGIMAPPSHVADPHDEFDLRNDELAQWHLTYHWYFDLGTLYTMIAGLLNILAIYDAYAGPLLVVDQKSAKRPPPDTSGARQRS